jgi:hypothetical protein
VSLLLAALSLAPGAARAASIEFPDGPVVLGRSEKAMALVRADAAPGDPAPPGLAVNARAFGDPERVGPGLWRVASRPPAEVTFAVSVEGEERSQAVARLRVPPPAPIPPPPAARPPAPFASFSWLVRSAELYAEASWGRAPVRTGPAQVDAAGLSLDAGFRVGAF